MTPPRIAVTASDHAELSKVCHSITEYAPLPMVTVEGPEHQVRYVNRAFCRLMGQNEAEMLGKSFMEILPERGGCIARMEEVFRTGQSKTHVEQEHFNPPLFWSYTLWPIMANQRTVGVMLQVTETARLHEQTVAMNEALMLGAVRQHELTEAGNLLNAQLKVEITVRKLAEEALRESAEFNRSIIESSPDCIKILDLQGRLLSILRGQERLGIVDVRPYLNKPWPEFWNDEDRKAAEGAVRKAAAGGEGKFVGLFCTLGSGESKWWDVAISPILDPQGRPKSLLAVSRDVTEQRYVQEALRVAQAQLVVRANELEKLVSDRTARLHETVAELEAFSYSIAHDMRAPLRAITSFARLVQTEHSGQLNATGQDLLARVVTAAQRLDRLIMDVLNYSSATRQVLDMQPVDLQALVEEAVFNEPALQPPRAVIHIETPLPKVIAHEPSLMQCTTNLLSNAVKFVAPGVTPKVTVRSELVGEEVRLWFEDNGIGISAINQKRIFTLFGRLNPTAEFEGTGIGLAIVGKATERMGGKFGVESEPGQGSRFWIQLRNGVEA